jgi:hypothetical protein
VSKEDAIVKQLENIGGYLKEIKEGILGETVTLKDIEAHLTKQDSEIEKRLNDIDMRLERQERTARRRFRFSIGLTFIVVSLSVLLASWSLGKTMEPRWFILTLFSLILLILGVILILLSKGNRKNRA